MQDDLISRQAVIDINESHHGQMPNHINHQIWQEIKDLPPVTPQPKTDVLDKIRAEIENDWQLKKYPSSPFSCGLRRAIEIIDKYRAESEDKE